LLENLPEHIAGQIMKYAGLFAAICCLIFFSSPSATSEDIKPNELGKVPILEYHLIQPEKSVWARTAEEFRQDLELLYSAGYRSISLSDYVQGKIEVPAGTRPVIFTFDDSSPGQFRYLVRNGKKEIDPDCAVGMFLGFKKRHPEFGMHATFFVLTGAKEPHKLFGQPEYESDKLKELNSLGFEIGNHTLWHAQLNKYSVDVVKNQLATAVKNIQAVLPGYKVHTLALPFGVYPKDINLAVDGAYKGTTYHNDAILRVSGGPAPSPYSARWDPLHLPRTQAGIDVKRMVDEFKKHPDEVFVSDGKADTVTYPEARKSELNSSRFKALHYVGY
jgi:peptidoglycan/xylan/chitin deacetylase (PgdA/CDA1 family)